jgi:hypothetical protein
MRHLADCGVCHSVTVSKDKISAPCEKSSKEPRILCEGATVIDRNCGISPLTVAVVDVNRQLKPFAERDRQTQVLVFSQFRTFTVQSPLPRFQSVLCEGSTAIKCLQNS